MRTDTIRSLQLLAAVLLFAAPAVAETKIRTDTLPQTNTENPAETRTRRRAEIVPKVKTTREKWGVDRLTFEFCNGDEIAKLSRPWCLVDLAVQGNSIYYCSAQYSVEMFDECVKVVQQEAHVTVTDNDCDLLPQYQEHCLSRFPEGWD